MFKLPGMILLPQITWVDTLRLGSTWEYITWDDSYSQIGSLWDDCSSSHHLSYHLNQSLLQSHFCHFYQRTASLCLCFKPTPVPIISLTFHFPHPHPWASSVIIINIQISITAPNPIQKLPYQGQAVISP